MVIDNLTLANELLSLSRTSKPKQEARTKNKEQRTKNKEEARTKNKEEARTKKKQEARSKNKEEARTKKQEHTHPSSASLLCFSELRNKSLKRGLNLSRS
jgi:hypothetical protein